MAGGSCSMVIFVEIIGGDESLHHQLKRQDRVSTSILFCTLFNFKSFETMNFFNYYRLEQYLQNNMPVQKIS